ncbi:hypothetical protein [Dyadobacter sp. CY347]|uniref:hypothetical protein n=1 Tax=Dyadobacter sp. CY347 TaxID=2909336 RepID=UPI001F4572F2|nr:hypothetical protein [Dyadobacter sp. CY347]MCF2488789.1 hypothetical protein [Dyadobacter sp. CY347]
MKASRSDISGFEDFRRYQNGEMSPRERHLLEKEMLENPLLADAYEGFMALEQDDIDLANIKKDLTEKLKSRISADRQRTIPIWAYGAAASLIITAGTFWLVFISNPKKSELREARQNLVEKPLMAPKSEPLPTLEKAPEVSVSAAQPAPYSPPKPRPNNVPEPNLAAAEREIEKEIRVAENTDQANAPAPAQTVEPARSYSARGQVRSSPAASSVREEPMYKKSDYQLSEAAAARQLVPLAAAVKSLQPVQASPLMGWDAYNAYLDQQTSAARSNGEVIVTFRVNADGTLSGFTASGKKQLQPEAIRIISGGPLWVPAKQNDSTLSTAVTLRLQFKK